MMNRLLYLKNLDTFYNLSTRVVDDIQRRFESDHSSKCDQEILLVWTC